MPQYVCEQCGTTFHKLSQLKQHQRTENHWIKHSCDICEKWFTRKNNLDQHMKKHNDLNNVHCDECGQAFSRPYTLNRHKERVHQVGGGQKRKVSNADGNVEATVTKRLRKDDDPRQFFNITKIKEQRIPKFRTVGSTYKVSFNNIEVTEDVLSTVRRLFAAIIEDLTKGAKSKDLVRLTVQTPSLDYPIVIGFDTVPTLTVDRFMAEIERVLQSNEDFAIDESLIMEVTIVDMPDGGVGKRCKFVNAEKFLHDKRCIIRIQNDDDLCCARAIVTAKARLDDHNKWNIIRQGYEPQCQLARQLHEQARVAPGKCGVEDIKKFQEVLRDYQIHVISADHFNAIIYCGPEAEKKIYLYYHDNHYDIITSMGAFLSRNYYCTRCNKGYDHKEDHKCNNVCYACRKVHKEEEDLDWLHCDLCNRFFRGHECFELHKKLTAKGHSTCQQIYRCEDCGKNVNKKLSKKPHTCGDKYCDVCRDFYPEGHQCFMIPEENDNELPIPVEGEMITKEENAKTFIFFYFECTQDDLIQCDEGYEPDLYGKCVHCLKSICGSYEHRPNLCVAQKVCTICMNERECDLCGEREHIFRGENTLDDFCHWLFSEYNYNSTVLCHNFQGYDSYPVLQYLYRHGILPTIIPNGAKVMCLTVPSCKIKMIDSINFLPMALAKLPSMFGLSELKKGYFPHLFNRRENQVRVLDTLPDVSYYNPDCMKQDDRDKFLTWYKEHKNDTFNLQQELLSYCRSDVDILRRCTLKFRDDFMSITGIDPYDRCITIASACNLVFRTNFLQHDTIALIPSHGYTPEHKQSVKAIQWIKYLTHILGCRIQHAQNGGEKTIGPYRVDGFYEKNDEKVVLEFHGDFWHGNPKMYSRSTVNPVNKMTMGELFDKTLEKKRYLENLGYIYESIWESDFDKQCQENQNIKSFIDQIDVVTPLAPRDAFFGGRTEAYTLYKQASENVDIDYYDVTSLYPWVNKTGKIPIGHPKIITENFDSLDNYEGLVKCKILPPKGLFHPILPVKVNGKLLFHLCKTCAASQQQMPCQHTEKERAFTSTWVIDEVKEALSMGYQLMKLYEIWHFDEISRYDSGTKTGGLFTEYVNTFLKIKQEASGWPEWVKTEKDKQCYIELYEQKEGIRLVYQNIEKNPGLRALAKLMLNSFWGKFGQRSNMQQVDIVDDPKIYFEKLTSDREEVTTVNFVSEDAVEMRWKYKEDFVEISKKTNVVIAAYTTSQARLKLHSYLKELGPRALYADTDSIIFTTQAGEKKPPLGDYLGDLTDEIQNNRIKTFVTGGPKNYGYELQDPDHNGKTTHCKVRGITLNYKNMMNVNFNVLKDFVTERPDATVSVVGAHKIMRDRNNARLLTVSEKKDYKLVFDKRVVREGRVSYPYGY